MDAIQTQLDAVHAASGGALTADAARIEALDTAGAWTLRKLLLRLRGEGTEVTLQGLRPEFARLLELVEQQAASQSARPAVSPAPPAGLLERVGRGSHAALRQVLDLLHFIGECAVALAGWIRHPVRARWRPILYNIRAAGFDALPIVGLLAFLLGIVVAYQAVDTLRRYGANVFVTDIVGLSMLREFAPLVTAVIVAGRSSSAFAAQIGTMQVTEEVDAMRTLGIPPLDMLVLPKLIALVIALPLLTVFADALGVYGGMLMARAHLGIGFEDFLDRMVKAVSITDYMLGVGKAPVFAAIIAVIGCFQGFRTKGGADAVGRQTTQAVVQAIFLVIVADSLFAIAFAALDL